MKGISKMWASALAVVLFPAFGLAQTETDISESLEVAERMVAEAEQALETINNQVDAVAKTTQQLARAVDFGRNTHGLAARIQLAIQTATHLDSVLTEFTRHTNEIRGMVEDIERRTENADSTTKARVAKLGDDVKQIDSAADNTTAELRGVKFKLAELREKVAGSTGGFGTAG